MATSSITKNFVISGKEQVEMFVNTIEESAKKTVVREIGEELGLNVKSVEYVKSYPYEKKEMLMLGFKAVAERKEFTLSGEVDLHSSDA